MNGFQRQCKAQRAQGEATTLIDIGSAGPNNEAATSGTPWVLHQLFDGNDPIEDLRLSGSVGVVVREVTFEGDAQLLIVGNTLTPTNTGQMSVAQLFLPSNHCGVIPTQRTIAWTTLEDRDVFTPLNAPSPNCHHHQTPMDHQQITMNPFNGSAA